EADGDEPVQVIDPPLAGVAGRLPVIDLSALPPALREGEGEGLARAEALAPFDLARGPLARFSLLRRAAEDHVLLLTLHHVVADGWSMGVLLRELAEHYAAGAAARSLRLVPPP